MQSKLPSQIIEQQEWLDGPAETLQNIVGKAYDALGEAREPVRRALNGDWYGHPLHPAVVIAPLGAFSTAIVLDAVAHEGDGVQKAADMAIGIGLVTSTLAAVTGATQWLGMKEREIKRVGLAHAAMNSAALGLFGASWILRKAKKYSVAKTLSAAGMTVLTYSAYLGGHMTYKLGAGVDE